jgi:hypothetical protein
MMARNNLAMVPKAAGKLCCILQIMSVLIMYNIYLIKLRKCCLKSIQSLKKQARRVCKVYSGTTECSVVGGYQTLGRYCLLKQSRRLPQGRKKHVPRNNLNHLPDYSHNPENHSKIPRRRQNFNRHRALSYASRSSFVCQTPIVFAHPHT